MSTVLFLANIPLNDPKRGTPIRIVNFLRQIKKKNTLVVCAHDVPADFVTCFVSYPTGNFFRRMQTLRALVRARHIQYIFTATEIGLLAPVLLKLMTGVKIAVDLHGLQTEELRAVGKINALQSVLLSVKVFVLLSFYNTVFTVTQKLADYYKPLSHAWIVIYGGVIPESIVPLKSRTSLRIGYAGNTRRYQGFENLLDATRILRDRDIPVELNLIISGDTGEVDAMLQARRLTDIADIARDLSHEEATARMCDADVLTILRPSIPITEYSFPSKLPEYLQTGIPVIMTAVGPVVEVSALRDCAIIIPPANIPEETARALERLYRMPIVERSALGVRARALVAQTFTWDTLGNTINAALDI